MTAEASALSSSVLMLNRLYMAVRVISARRALTLLYQDSAEVVAVEDGQFLSYDFDDWVEVSRAKRRFEPEQHDWVRTVHFQIAVPKIVRLLVYDRLPRTSVKLNRRNLFARDQNRCQYCGKRFPSSELSLDHVVPRSRGGGNTWEKHRLCLCALQCAQGRSHAERGQHEAHRRAARPHRSPVLTIKLSIRVTRVGSSSWISRTGTWS
jgi:5-methylcytosine-specific restriction endonuclease McrA